MSAAESAKKWADLPDAQLIDKIIESPLPSETKALTILSLRQRRVEERHNRILLGLTVVLTLATLLQAYGALRTS